MSECWCVACPFQALAAAGTLKQNYANILLMLLRLRQACDHPILVKGNQSEYGGDGSIEMAKKLPKNVVIDLLAKLEVGSACSLCDVSNLISRCYFDVHLLSISFSLLFGCNHMSLMCTAGCVMSWIHWVVRDGLPCRLITPT